jgi:hypothetical protein
MASAAPSVRSARLGSAVWLALVTPGPSPPPRVRPAASIHSDRAFSLDLGRPRRCRCLKPWVYCERLDAGKEVGGACAPSGQAAGASACVPRPASRGRDLVVSGIPVAEAARQKGVARATLQRFMQRG